MTAPTKTPINSILFVCTGNICRSPTAEYVLKKMLVDAGLEGIVVESRGTSSFHNGEGADERAVAYAKTRGVDMSGHVVRGISRQDVIDFDLILCADYEHVVQVKAMMHSQFHDKIKLFLREYAPKLGVVNVPDPYYGGESGFARVYDLTVAGCSGVIDDIISKSSHNSTKRI